MKFYIGLDMVMFMTFGSDTSPIQRGAFGKHWFLSEETKQKMRKPKSGKHRRNLSRAMKDRKCPWIVEWNKKYKSRQMKQKNPMDNPSSRVKLSESLKGRVTSPYTLFKFGCDNVMWMGGKSSEPYGREFNEELKKEIRTRDGYVCYICKKMITRDLHVHHIDFNKQNNNRYNLISLCRSCHNFITKREVILSCVGI